MDNKDRVFDTSGYNDKQNHIRDLKLEVELEVIENIYNDRDYIIELETEEFVSICPKTGLPDFAKIIISYVPDKYLVEEKSLKLYLTSFRNIGIFQENATNKIFDDFNLKILPKWLNITSYWNQRGGIGVKVEVEKEFKEYYI